MDNINIKTGYELYFGFDDISLFTHKAIVHGGYFYGPVILSNHVKLLEEDNIVLDFSHQYRIVTLSDYYYVKLGWSGIDYRDSEVIELTNSYLFSDNTNLLKSFIEDCFLIIDTYDHREEVHARYPMYKAWILDKEGCPL